jgi:hypothetical protein
MFLDTDHGQYLVPTARPTGEQIVAAWPVGADRRHHREMRVLMGDACCPEARKGRR